MEQDEVIVSLSYIIEDERRIYSPFSATTVKQTYYPQRSGDSSNTELFGDDINYIDSLDDYIERVEYQMTKDGYDVGVSIYPDEVAISEIDRPRLIAGSEKNLVVTFEGNKDGLKEFMSRIAQENYGLPDQIYLLSNYIHPIKSVRGYNSATQFKEELLPTFKAVSSFEKYVNEDGRDTTRESIRFVHEDE